MNHFKLIIICATLVGSISLNAQNVSNSLEKKGPVCEVTVGYYQIKANVDVSMGAAAEISSGYSFGKGIYLGVGSGVRFWNNSPFPDYYDNSKLIPMFVEARYSFLNTPVKPFVDIKGGILTNLTTKSVDNLVRPAVGLSYGRFSCSVGTELLKMFGTEARVIMTEGDTYGPWNTTLIQNSIKRKSLFIGVSYLF